jgi:hypothetical protein
MKTKAHRPEIRPMRLIWTHDLFGKPGPTFPDHALGRSKEAGVPVF